eukprot:11096729-Lingulodinium_polyedra.AAC.1
MEQALQTALERLDQLQTAFQQQQATHAAEMGQMQQAVQTAQRAAQEAANAQAAAAAVPNGAGPPVAAPEVQTIDTRLLGKPDSFDGATGWRDWSVVFRSYVAACNTRMGTLMAAHESDATP